MAESVTAVIQELNKLCPGQALIVLVGLPGSGKSHVAAELASRCGALVINADAITAMVHGGHYGNYEKRLKKYYKLIEYQAVISGLLTGRSVVIDHCNEGITTRATWVRLANSLDVPVVAIEIFEPDLTKLLRRRMTDHRGLSTERWRYVIENRATRYAEPTQAEGFYYVSRMRSQEG